MKLSVTFKTPDAVDDVLQEPNFDSNNYEEEYEEYLQMKKCIERFVEYGEYITVEFDSETNTARVLE